MPLKTNINSKAPLSQASNACFHSAHIPHSLGLGLVRLCCFSWCM